MTKKIRPPEVLSLRERMLNGWTPDKRRLQESRYIERLPDDPDEHTIYNVLCPQLRSKWRDGEEYERRVTKAQPVDYGIYDTYHNSRVIHTSPVE